MSGFPKLCDPRSISGRVLVLAPHPDDEVLGAGGLLAACADHGATLRVWIATDGAAGFSGEARNVRAALRALESRRAGALLGLSDYDFADLPDGGLGAQWSLTERVGRVIDEFKPAWLLAPSPLELHDDHAALAAAVCAALAVRPDLRVLFYGVNTPVPAGVLFDIGATAARKYAALREFVSQDGASLAEKAAALDRARTLNIDDGKVTAVEGFVELSGLEALEYARRAQALANFGTANAAPDDPWAATAVITTWNKCQDLCENLDGLRAQTRPFTAIVVVDNASRDDTAAVLASRTAVVMARSPLRVAWCRAA